MINNYQFYLLYYVISSNIFYSYRTWFYDIDIRTTHLTLVLSIFYTRGLYFKSSNVYILCDTNHNYNLFATLPTVY